MLQDRPSLLIRLAHRLLCPLVLLALLVRQLHDDHVDARIGKKGPALRGHSRRKLPALLASVVQLLLFCANL